MGDERRSNWADAQDLLRDHLALVSLVGQVKSRRIGSCETPPCEAFVPKDIQDPDLGSCQRCGWFESEHVIDALLAAVERHVLPAGRSTEHE